MSYESKLVFGSNLLGIAPLPSLKSKRVFCSDRSHTRLPDYKTECMKQLSKKNKFGKIIVKIFVKI